MTMHPVRWLHEELPKLVQGGILDTATADRLKQHYGPPPRSPWKTGAMVLIGTLGSMLLGGGIILLFAHNWEALTRPTRAALAFALLIVAQLFAGFAVLKKSDSAAWTEGAAVFLSGAVVASIALIAQTYQIVWEIDQILLAWVLLMAPLIYALRSRMTAALVWVGSTWWLFARMEVRDDLIYGLAYLALAALAVPFMVQQFRNHRDEGRTLLLNWTAGLALTSGSDPDRRRVRGSMATGAQRTVRPAVPVRGVLGDRRRQRCMVAGAVPQHRSDRPCCDAVPVHVPGDVERGFRLEPETSAMCSRCS